MTERSADPSKRSNKYLTPEEIEALARVQKHFARSRPNKHVLMGGLKPWMRQFAAWYAIEGSAYPRQQQLHKASALAHGRLNHPGLLHLLRRPDFLALVDRYTEDTVEATRDQFKDMLPKVADNLEWAMDTARSKEDYKAMPNVVEPVLVRTMPKRDDTPAAPPQIVINLGGHFAKQYSELPMQEVEVEELAPPKEGNE